jgi:glycosyltransferase involved in cell wall biosynthesis
MISEGGPRVSVCIPTMNRPHQFRDALASVDSQTFRDFEIVVGDNSGNAESQRAIDRVLDEFTHLPVRLVRHEKTLEPALNFNSLIDEARGEFWVCLPDDDRLCSNFLARSVAALQTHPECSFTFADHWILLSDGTTDVARSRANSVAFGRDSLQEGVVGGDSLFGAALRQAICLQASMFRRRVLASFRFTPRMVTLDFSLQLRLGAATEPMSAYYISERLMEYRVHSDQISATTRRSELLSSTIAALESIERVPQAHAKSFHDKLSRQYLALALVEAEDGSRAAARMHAVKSVKIAGSTRTFLGAALVILAPRSIPLARRLAVWMRG